jgi:hypothetical protein
VDIYPDSLEDANWTVTSDVDLSSATAEVYIAAGWHSLTWTGAAVQSGSTWTRTGQILLAGANPVTGLKPTTADRHPLTRVTVGGEVVVRPSTGTLAVRAA